MLHGFAPRSAAQLVSLRRLSTRRCTIKSMQAQREPSGTQPVSRQRMAARPKVQPVESLSSLDLDDLDDGPARVTNATKQARLQESLDAQVAKTLLPTKLAIICLGAVLLAERVTGRSVVQYLTDSDMMPNLPEANPILALLAAALVVTAVVSTGAHLRGAMQQVQAWAGRAACISLAGVLTSEMLTGEAVLELLNIETGVGAGLSEPEAVGAFLVLLLLTGGKARS